MTLFRAQGLSCALLLSLFSASTATAQPGRWEHINQWTDPVILVDTTTWRLVSPKSLSAWVRIDYPNPKDKTHRAIGRWEFDCQSRRYRLVGTITSYGSDLEIRESEDHGTGTSWKEATPETVSEALILYACGK